MQPWMIAAVIAVIGVVAVVIWFTYDHNRRRHLRERFGPEYDRAVHEMGNRYRAEAELARREAHAKQIRNKQLNPLDRDKFLSQWKLCQAQFVDDPTGALDRADELLGDAMRARGYSVDTPFDRMTDIAAAYPQHANRYREACDIVGRHKRGELSTEELRTAFLHYRTLFDDMLGGYDEELKRAS
jgi:hypothetical protein